MGAQSELDSQLTIAITMRQEVKEDDMVIVRPSGRRNDENEKLFLGVEVSVKMFVIEYNWELLIPTA